jgi:AraC-like DNA-binding protein
VVSLIRTDDVPASLRREAWRQVVCDTLGPLDFRMDPDAPLSGDSGELAIYDFGRPYELDYRAAVQLAVFTFPPASAARLSSVVLDVLTTSISERLHQDSAVPPESHRRTLMLRIHAFIEQHLADPELNPAAIAAAHHISSRYLHRLFALDDTTVAGWIRQRRLERCRKDLTDPFLRTLPVSAIAARRGLPDPAHFSRLFRGAYGLPPGDYRRASLAAGPR